MKKTIVLLTIVLAIIAAPVFAETGFSGSVDYNFGTDFDTYKDGTDNSTAITLDGKVGEFSTVSIGIEADDDSNASATIMTLTQDVTGALGVEGPVTFSYKVGRQTYSPADYSGVAGYEDAGADAEIGKKWLLTVDPDTSAFPFTAEFDTDSMMGLVLTFGIVDMVNVDIALYPGSFYEVGDYTEATAFLPAGEVFPEFAVNAYGTFGPVDASVYYVASKATNAAEKVTVDEEIVDGITTITYTFVDSIDTNGSYIGFNAGATIDALKVGALVEVAPDQEIFDIISGTLVDQGGYIGRYGVAAQYTIDALTSGLAFSSKFSDIETKDTFATSSAVGLNLTYAVTEAANVWAAFATPFDVLEGDLVDSMAYEFGAEASLDGVTYGVGYTKGSEFKAYDAELEDGNVFVSISASF